MIYNTIRAHRNLQSVRFSITISSKMHFTSEKYVENVANWPCIFVHTAKNEVFSKKFSKSTLQITSDVL